MGRLEPHVLRGHVAERPNRLIRVAVVIPADFRIGEPYAAEGVRRCLRRHPRMPRMIGDLEVGIPTSPGYPHPADGLQHRIQRRCQTARWTMDHDPTTAVAMFIGLPVANNNQRATVQERLDVSSSCVDHRIPLVPEGDRLASWT